MRNASLFGSIICLLVGTECTSVHAEGPKPGAFAIHERWTVTTKAGFVSDAEQVSKLIDELKSRVVLEHTENFVVLSQIKLLEEIAKSYMISSGISVEQAKNMVKKERALLDDFVRRHKQGHAEVTEQDKAIKGVYPTLEAAENRLAFLAKAPEPLALFHDFSERSLRIIHAATQLAADGLPVQKTDIESFHERRKQLNLPAVSDEVATPLVRLELADKKIKQEILARIQEDKVNFNNAELRRACIERLSAKKD